MEKNKLSKNSSLLVSLPAICLYFVLLLLSAVGGYAVLAGLFMFFLLFFSFLRYWASKAMDGVGLELCCDNRQLFPGMDTRLEYTLKNDKLLPLLWLELSQQTAEKNCVLPDDSFESYTYPKNVGDSVEEISAHRRSFSLVMGYESISLSSVWHAARRGIYCPKELLLRSGDGFGLTQVEKNYSPELLPEIVVYPKRVSVDGEIFIRQDWDSNFGALGFKEDMSVMRGLRPYTNADSFKRINWRMAARNPNELSVNFHETIQPATALFILDGESYCEDEETLERDLELIASSIDWLISRGLSCGLCLPKSKALAAVNISPEQQPTSAELMYYLAAYDCLKLPVLDKNDRPSGKFYPSSFDLQAVSRACKDAGTIALFTNKPESLSPQLLERIENARLLVFSSSEQCCKDKELRLLHTNTLKKEAGI